MREMERIRMEKWLSSRRCLLSIYMMILVYNQVSDVNSSRLCDLYGLVPGLGKLTHSVDVSTFDIMPMRNPLDQKLKHPLFEFTCNENKFWQHSSTYYDQPDQVATVVTIPGGSASVEMSLYKTSKQVRDHLNFYGGISGGISAFTFALSGSYKENVESITTGSQYTQDVSSFTSTARAELLPAYELYKFINADAKKLIDEMIEPYEVNSTVYDTFIEKYGTHYISKANFGGVMKLHLETKKDSMRGKSSEEIQLEAEASYALYVTAKVKLTTSEESSSSTYTSSTSQTTTYYGGQANLLEKQGWQKWQPTVFYNPWMFKCQLKPIADLIQDQEKRENLKMAVDQYVMRNFSMQLKRLLGKLKTYYPSKEALNVIADRISFELNKKILMGDVLETLSDELEHVLE